MKRKQRELAYLFVLAIVVIFVVLPVASTGLMTFDEWWDSITNPDGVYTDPYSDEPTPYQPGSEPVSTEPTPRGSDSPSSEFTCETLRNGECSFGTCSALAADCVTGTDGFCKCQLPPPTTGTTTTPCSKSAHPKCDGVCEAGFNCDVNETLCYCMWYGWTYLSCVDSDGGNKPGVFGSVSGQRKSNVDGTISNYKFDDKCSCSGLQITEQICDVNGNPGVLVNNCPNGCANGACK